MVRCSLRSVWSDWRFFPRRAPCTQGYRSRSAGSASASRSRPLSRAALRVDSGLTRSGTLTIGFRHVGLVVALVLIAPLVARDLEPAANRATLNATAVILEGQIPLTKKIPLALDMSEAFGQARRGEIPDLTGPFDKQGAKTDASVAALRNDLIAAIEAAITHGFRNAFFLCALFAILVLVPVLAFRRRAVA